MPTTFTNQATLAYNNQTIPSNIVTGVLTEALTVTKTSLPSTYRAGDTITYSVNLVNSGATAINDLTVTDNLGSFTPLLGGVTVVPMTYVTDTVRFYVNGVLQTTPTITATSPLTVTGLTLPAGANATLLYSAKTNEFTPYGAQATVNNTASVTGGGLATALTSTAVITADTTPQLSVTKSLCPTTVTANEPLRYTFTIQNSGATATTTTDAVSLTDTFTPPMTITSVTRDGVAQTLGTDYTYDGSVFTTVTPLIVPAATYTRNATTGVVTVTPGTVTLVVTGTL